MVDDSGLLDEYSDIDIYLDVEDEQVEAAIAAVEASLRSLSPIDYRYRMDHPHPKLRQVIYHLENTSAYLMIDFCVQLHSRPAAASCFVQGNLVEAAHVLFDKAGVITSKPFRAEEYRQQNMERLQEARYRYTQHIRVVKYIQRGQYPEAHIYYHRYVVEPLVDLLRLIHTPANADYHMIHISHHIPQEDLARLTPFLKISTLEQMEDMIPKAQAWFAEMEKQVQL